MPFKIFGPDDLSEYPLNPFPDSKADSLQYAESLAKELQHSGGEYSVYEEIGRFKAPRAKPDKYKIRVRLMGLGRWIASFEGSQDPNCAFEGYGNTPSEALQNLARR